MYDLNTEPLYCRQVSVFCLCHECRFSYNPLRILKRIYCDILLSQYQCRHHAGTRECCQQFLPPTTIDILIRRKFMGLPTPAGPKVRNDTAVARYKGGQRPFAARTSGDGICCKDGVDQMQMARLQRCFEAEEPRQAHLQQPSRRRRVHMHPLF